MSIPSGEFSQEKCNYMRLQRRADLSYYDIADNTECTIEEAMCHVLGRCDCEDEIPPLDDDTPWREPQVIKELFLDENMHFTEMSEALGCHPETARNWVLRYEISPVDSKKRTSSKTVRRLQRIGAENEKSQSNSETEKYRMRRK